MAAGSFCLLPYATDVTQLGALLVPLALGISTLHSIGIAYTFDLTSDEERAQGIGLQRTAVDVGYIVGASSAGVIASMTSIESGIFNAGGLLGLSTLYLGMRMVAKYRNDNASNSE